MKYSFQLSGAAVFPMRNNEMILPQNKLRLSKLVEDP